jgi:hypothetical protein
MRRPLERIGGRIISSTRSAGLGSYSNTLRQFPAYTYLSLGIYIKTVRLFRQRPFTFNGSLGHNRLYTSQYVQPSVSAESSILEPPTTVALRSLALLCELFPDWPGQQLRQHFATFSQARRRSGRTDAANLGHLSRADFLTFTEPGCSDTVTAWSTWRKLVRFRIAPPWNTSSCTLMQLRS